MLHLTKLAVGIKDTDHLREVQTQRARQHGRLWHRTRNFPRRGNEVIDGGSMYWVIAGTMLVRQRIVDIVEDQRDYQTPCTSLILDAGLVPLVGRVTRAFQGWRYLDSDDAPPDLPALGAVMGLESLPVSLQRELRALCLL